MAPTNDFQLQFLYILHNFLLYDTCEEAKQVIGKLKTYYKSADDVDTKVYI